MKEKEIEVTVNNYQCQTCKVCHSLACHFDELADNLNARLQVLNSAHLRHCPELHLIELVQEAVEVGGDLAELVLPKDVIHILTLWSVHQGRRGGDGGEMGGRREGDGGEMGREKNGSVSGRDACTIHYITCAHTYASDTHASDTYKCYELYTVRMTET